MSTNRSSSTAILGSPRSKDGMGAPPFDEATEVTLTADGDQTIPPYQEQAAGLTSEHHS
ncbi:MAG TPA: hypothetical protein VKE27_10375 [Candidatus Dormibacteraeota bacterium]|nr:hypothetical protein [Candidatus Dormibacteraeota bacterium]